MEACKRRSPWAGPIVTGMHLDSNDELQAVVLRQIPSEVSTLEVSMLLACKSALILESLNDLVPGCFHNACI